MSTLSLERKVGELVTERPARARLFERLGIDYCCGGGATLAEAAAKRELDPDQLLAALAEVDASPRTEAEADWASAPMSELIDHIVEVHHGYLREALPRLTYLIDRVAQAHGDRRPELLQLAREFSAVRQEIDEHAVKEEQVLFPACRALEGGQQVMATLLHPIHVLIHEHDSIGEHLARMRALTDGFTPPEDACNTYRAMLDGLAEMEADLHRHIHEENNILFPKARAAEARLAGAA